MQNILIFVFVGFLVFFGGVFFIFVERMGMRERKKILKSDDLGDGTGRKRVEQSEDFYVAFEG